MNIDIGDNHTKFNPKMANRSAIVGSGSASSVPVQERARHRSNHIGMCLEDPVDIFISQLRS